MEASLLFFTDDPADRRFEAARSGAADRGKRDDGKVLKQDDIEAVLQSAGTKWNFLPFRGLDVI